MSRPARRLRPPAIVLTALAITLLFAVLHALGARRSTAALAGIVSDPLDAVLALVYLGTWFFSALLTPIVILSWTIGNALSPRGRGSRPSRPSPP